MLVVLALIGAFALGKCSANSKLLSWLRKKVSSALAKAGKKALNWVKSLQEDDAQS